MIFKIKRISLLLTACVAAITLSACETTTEASKAATGPTIEHLALGMELNFPTCTAKTEGENTSISSIDGQVCQFLLEEGQVAGYNIKSYAVLLSEGINEGFSSQVNMNVNTVDNKVISFSIVTPGLQYQEHTFNLLVDKFGEPVEAILVSEDIPNGAIAINSVFASWNVEGGRIIFAGGLKGKNAGIINGESHLLQEIQQKLQQTQQQ